MHQFDCKCKYSIYASIDFLDGIVCFFEVKLFCEKEAQKISLYAFNNLKKQYRYKVKHLRVVAKHMIA